MRNVYEGMTKTISTGAVFMMALGCGGSPAAPDPSQSLTTSSGYTVSGVVTNESGAPLAGATIVLDHGDNLPDLNSTTQRVTATTGPNGRYSLSLAPEQVRRDFTPFAILRASVRALGIRANVQLLDGQGASAVRNIRLVPYRGVAIGDSTAVSIDSDTPLCDIDGLSVTTVCDVVHGIHYPSGLTGTITIEARPLAATVVPTVRTWGGRAGKGTLSLSFPFVVDIGDVAMPLSIAIEVPVGTPPQRYEVVTRLD